MRSAARTAKLLLRRLFRRNGYVRLPNLKRRKKEGPGYRKGFEVRLTANTAAELRQIRQALHEIGLHGGRPYRKVTQSVQPVYGRPAVQWFDPQALKALRPVKKTGRAKKTGRKKAKRSR